MNRVTIYGRLGQDPEVKTTGGGLAVCNLNVAIKERVKKGDNWEDHTEWIRAVAFGRTAENCGKYLSKGREVLIEGKMRTRKWEKDGVTRYTTEVLADTVTFIGGGGNGNSETRRSDSSQKPAQQSQRSQPKAAVEDPFGGEPQGEQPMFDDSDIPF
jgi:single-strand DNA-binding protein